MGSGCSWSDSWGATMTLEHDHSVIHLLKQVVVAPQESDQLHPLPIAFPPQCIRHLDVQSSFF